jgi:hypothetical protein
MAQNNVPYPGSSHAYSQPSTDHPSYPPLIPGRTDHQLPIQQPIPPYVHNRGGVSNDPHIHSGGSPNAASRFPFEALRKQKDVIIQEMALDNDMTIPTNTGDPPYILLKKGQQVMFIRTPKGVYLRMGDKIIKIKLSPSQMGSLRAASNTAVGAAQGPPQVVTIDSSSDSEGGQNGTERNLQSQQQNQQRQPPQQQQQTDLLGGDIPAQIANLQVDAEDFQPAWPQQTDEGQLASISGAHYD